MHGGRKKEKSMSTHRPKRCGGAELRLVCFVELTKTVFSTEKSLDFSIIELSMCRKVVAPKKIQKTSPIISFSQCKCWRPDSDTTLAADEHLLSPSSPHDHTLGT